MDALHLVRRMTHNEAWANLRLHNAIARLDAAEYRLDTRTSFFPSIHRTLVHIWFVGDYYVDALEGGGRGKRVWEDYEPAEARGDFAEVRAGQASVDRRLLAYVDSLPSPEALDGPARMERSNRIQVDSVGNVLLHLLQHQIHHRGQVHAMLSGTPVKPPQLDEFYLRDELPIRETELRALGLPLV